jgi:DNA (cytosine-5)-methyltransferase 3A
MNILSLFDGCSCGQLALERAGIPINTYYASEINPSSIKITQKNYPNTIQLGDVTQLTYQKIKKLHKIDILIGGSPCEDLTITAVDRKDINKGLEGDKSKLFFEYVRILDTVNPKYFLLENVASMTDENKIHITKLLGVEPILIDSGLVSAQDRLRYYWTNISNITQPKDKGLILEDIMEVAVDNKYYYDKNFEFYGLDKKVCGKLQVNTHDLCKRVYNPNFKCATLTAVQGGYQEKKVYDNGKVRKLTPVEYERLQTLPDNYTYGVSNSARYSLCGDGWTVDVIAHILSHINL